MQTGRSGPRRGLGQAVLQASCLGALSTEPGLSRSRPSKPQPQVTVVSKGEVTLPASPQTHSSRNLFLQFSLDGVGGRARDRLPGSPKGLKTAACVQSRRAATTKGNLYRSLLFCFEYTVSLRPAYSASLAYDFLWSSPDSGCGRQMVSPWLKPHHSRTGCRGELEELEGRCSGS